MKEGLLGGKLRLVAENEPRGGPITMLHAGLDLSRKKLFEEQEVISAR